MTGINTVIFDLDCTLLDTAHLLSDAKVYALNHLGVKDIDPDVVEFTNGIPLVVGLQIISRSDSEVFLAEARRLYAKRLLDTTLSEARLFPETKMVLDELKRRNIKIGFFSIRPGEYFEKLVKHFGLDKYSDTFIAEDEAEMKPAPDMAEFLIEQLGSEPHNTLTVGDMGVDIEMGQRAGTRTCAITWGTNSRRVLETYHPDLIIDNLAKLPAMLR